MCLYNTDWQDHQKYVYSLKFGLTAEGRYIYIYIYMYCTLHIKGLAFNPSVNTMKQIHHMNGVCYLTAVRPKVNLIVYKGLPTMCTIFFKNITVKGLKYFRDIYIWIG